MSGFLFLVIVLYGTIYYLYFAWGKYEGQIRHLLSSSDTVDTFVQKLGTNMKDPKFQALLNAGLRDGMENDDKLEIVERNVPVTLFMPTQSQISMNTCLEVPLADSSGDSFVSVYQAKQGDVAKNVPAIMAAARSDGKYTIFDGHHRWGFLMMVNPKISVKCKVFNFYAKGVNNPRKMLKYIHLAIAAVDKKVSGKDADTRADIFRMKTDDIRLFWDDLRNGTNYGGANSFYNPYWNTSNNKYSIGWIFRRMSGDSAHTVNVLYDNSIAIRTYRPRYPIKRKFMPQIDQNPQDSGLSDEQRAELKIKALRAGTVNLFSPFVKRNIFFFKEEGDTIRT